MNPTEQGPRHAPDRALAAAELSLAATGILAVLLLSLPALTAVPLPATPARLAALPITAATGAGIGWALASQPPLDEGNRAVLNGLLAGLLSMGALTIGGMLVVGRSDGLFFAAAAGAMSFAVLAAVQEQVERTTLTVTAAAAALAVGLTMLGLALFGPAAT